MTVTFPTNCATQSLEKNFECKFNVSYLENLTDHELLHAIASIANPQVLLWYIGSHGLKADGVNFYKEKISSILTASNNASCFLLDLTAWAAFYNNDAKIGTSSRCADQINSFNISKLKCIKASEIFSQICTLKNPEIIHHFRDCVTARTFVRQKSSEARETGIKVGKIFDSNCQILERLFEQDAGKCYSVVQYVEGCFLARQIIESQLEGSGDINIVFSLPNDESKYYKDENNSFKTDVEILVKNTLNNFDSKRNVNIYFFTFNYGDALYKRPYNEGKKVLKTIKENMIMADAKV